MAERFSVLIPTYNREQHLRQAIDSVLAQTFTDFELFVIDDGSTDGTAALLKSYGSRVRVLSQRNQGPEIARNRAAALARGEYLVMMDSDDLFFPWALATYDRVIRELASPPLVIGAMTYFRDGHPVPKPAGSESGIEVSRSADFFAKDVGVGLSNSRIVLRRAVFEKVGGYRNDTTPKTFHLDDFNLIMKVGTVSPCAIIGRPVTVAYRAHESNSIRGMQSMIDGIVKVIRTERSGAYPGGDARRMARYACIGGISQLWIRNALKAGEWSIGLGLAGRSLPMLAASFWRKFTSPFHPPHGTLLRLEDQVPAASRAASIHAETPQALP